MRMMVGSTPALLLLLALTATYSQDPGGNPEPAKIAWGDAVDGLQLGLAPQTVTIAIAPAVAERANALVEVSLRNTAKSPVRLLASVHTCLLGAGGTNALLASKLVLKPKAGGNPFILTYAGWNHLSLLDKRRPKSEQPQQTLNGSFGKMDIQLNPEDAKRMTTVLVPGEIRVTPIAFTLSDSNSTSWRFEGSTSVPAGTYVMTAVLQVDQELSDWKGELTSGPVEVSILRQAAK